MSQPDVEHARAVLHRHLLDMAVEHELDARGHRGEHAHHDAPGASDADGRRFALEHLAAQVERLSADSPTLQTLADHHESCGGSDEYRPGPRVRAVLEAARPRRDDREDFWEWERAAWAEMGRSLDDEEDR